MSYQESGNRPVDQGLLSNSPMDNPRHLIHPATEGELRELLSGSETAWQAGVHVYDFLHQLAFNPDGTGAMKSGGGQTLHVDVNFNYTMIPRGGLQFEYLPTDNKSWGLRFRPTDRNRIKVVGFELEDGPIPMEEPYVGIKNYGKALRLTSSPFPNDSEDAYGGNLFFRGDPNDDVRLQTFYGYREKEIYPFLEEYSEEGYWLHRILTREKIDDMRGWSAYKRNSTEWIIEQAMIMGTYGFEASEAVRKKLSDLRKVFCAAAYPNLPPDERSRFDYVARIEPETLQRQIEITDEVRNNIRWIWETFNLKLPPHGETTLVQTLLQLNEINPED